MTDDELLALVEAVDLVDFIDDTGSFLTEDEMRTALIHALRPALKRAGL